MGKADIAIWGPPGTGKTTRLLNLMTEEIHQSKRTINDIALSTFRKPLAMDAREKIKDKLDMASLPEDTYIGTTHSICLQLLREEDYDYDVVESRDRKEFCKEFGVDYRAKGNKTGGVEDVQIFDPNIRGNTLFQIYSYKVNNPNEKWTDGPITEEMLSKINKRMVEDFVKEWERYKNTNYLIDFCDMLKWVHEKELFPHVDVLIEDEFQDKTPLQYEIYKDWAAHIPEVWIAGDPLQAIYSFFGTEPSFFENEYKGAEDQEVRPKSYRFSSELYEYARAIPEKVGIETPDIEGREDYETKIRFIDMNDFKRKVTNFRGESVLYLLRANYMKGDIVRILRDRGIPYVMGFGSNSKITELYNAVVYARRKLGNQDMFASTRINMKGRSAYRLLTTFPASHFDCVKKEVKKKAKKNEWIDLPVTPKFVHHIFQENPFTNLLGSAGYDEKDKKQLNEFLHRRNAKPMDPDKKHTISTIHGSKGREADYVFLFGDRTRRIAKSGNRKDESRVFFVGATRARKKLFIVDGPNRQYRYKFP